MEFSWPSVWNYHSTNTEKMLSKSSKTSYKYKELPFIWRSSQIFWSLVLTSRLTGWKHFCVLKCLDIIKCNSKYPLWWLSSPLHCVFLFVFFFFWCAISFLETAGWNVYFEEYILEVMPVTVYNTLQCQAEKKQQKPYIKVDGDRLLSVFRESGFSCTILPVFLLSELFIFSPTMWSKKISYES